MSKIEKLLVDWLVEGKYFIKAQRHPDFRRDKLRHRGKELFYWARVKRRLIPPRVVEFLNWLEVYGLLIVVST